MSPVNWSTVAPHEDQYMSSRQRQHRYIADVASGRIREHFWIPVEPPPPGCRSCHTKVLKTPELEEKYPQAKDEIGTLVDTDDESSGYCNTDSESVESTSTTKCDGAPRSKEEQAANRARRHDKAERRRERLRCLLQQARMKVAMVGA